MEGRLWKRRRMERGVEGLVMGAGAEPAVPPCGACKFLRRKCLPECIFAPYFATELGVATFPAVHKVFGASNVAKHLMGIPEECRADAVISISYEAQARFADPVYGCVGTILALQHQVASLRAELSLARMQLLSSKLISEPPTHTAQFFPAHQPFCPINSSASLDYSAIPAAYFSNATVAEASPPGEHIFYSHPAQLIDGDEGIGQAPAIFMN